MTSGKDTVLLKTQCSPLALRGPGKNTKVKMQAQLQGGHQAGARLPSPLLEQGPAEKGLSAGTRVAPNHSLLYIGLAALSFSLGQPGVRHRPQGTAAQKSSISHSGAHPHTSGEVETKVPYGPGRARASNLLVPSIS